MRWSRFRYKGKVAFGIVEGEKIIEVSGNPFESYIKTGNRFDLNEVELFPPVIPKTIYCAGQNYIDHIIKSAKRKGRDPIIPQKPDFNYRAVNSLIGHEGNIVIPKDAGEPIQTIPAYGQVCGTPGAASPRLSFESWGPGEL